MKFFRATLLYLTIVLLQPACNNKTQTSENIQINDLLKIKAEGMAYLDILISKGILKFSGNRYIGKDAQIFSYDPVQLIDGKASYKVSYLNDLSTKSTAAMLYSFRKKDYGKFKNQIEDLDFTMESTTPIEFEMDDSIKTKLPAVREVFSNNKKDVLIVLEQVQDEYSYKAQSVVNVKIVTY